MLSTIKILFKKGEIKNGIFSIVNSCLELFGASCSCENSVLLGTVFTILSGCIHFSSITNRYVLRQSSIYLQIFNKIESLSLTFFFCLSCIPAPSNTKSCKKPTPPPNAHLRLASQALREWFSNGERVYYQCNTGYSQTGFFIQRCSKGQWLPAKSLLTCIG